MSAYSKHREAQVLYSEALMSLRIAAALELQAAHEAAPTNEPLRSRMFIAAAVMYMGTGEYRLALDAIQEGLRGYPAEKAKIALWRLYFAIGDVSLVMAESKLPGTGPLREYKEGN